MNKTKKKNIIWIVISITAGVLMIFYMLSLLYYNPFYRYEEFLKKEWFYVISCIVIGIIFAFFMIESMIEEREHEELYRDYIFKIQTNDNLNKENLRLINEIKKQDNEIEFLKSLIKEADKGNSMLNETAASRAEEPPHTQI